MGTTTREEREVVMNKCDKCENMARVTVSGYLVARYLCARHAGELCESVGDSAGVAKFKTLEEGDRLPIGAGSIIE
jgi:hypothetical protein